MKDKVQIIAEGTNISNGILVIIIMTYLHYVFHISVSTIIDSSSQGTTVNHSGQQGMYIVLF